MRQKLRRFRPLGFADMLDETVEIYRSNFLLLVGISALISLPFILAQNLAKRPPSAMTDPRTAMGFAVAYMVVNAVSLVVTQIVTGALTYAISERYLQRETTIMACFRRIFSWHVFWRFGLAVATKFAVVWMPMCAIVAIIFLIAFSTAATGGGASAVLGAVGLGLVLGIGALAYAVYMGLRLLLLEPALIVEMKGVGHAFNRTWQLMDGHMVRAFALILVVTVVLGTITGALIMPTTLMSSDFRSGGPPPSHSIVAINLVITSVVSALSEAITPIVIILFYYDVRIRKEGYDLELLAADLGVQSAQPGGTPSVAAHPQEQLRTPYTQEFDLPSEPPATSGPPEGTT